VRTLDRYLLREFLLFSLVGVVGFVGIIVIVDLFEKIDVFVDHQTPPALVLEYYALGIPLIIVETLPVALLLGAILSMGQLKRWGELTAMQAAGVAPYRIVAPLLVAGAVASVGCFLLAEGVTSTTEQQRRELYDTRIRGRRHPSQGNRTDLILLGRGGRLYLARSYDAARRMLRAVSVQKPAREGQQLQWRLDAASAAWKDGVWQFRNGILRVFRDTTETAVPFRRYASTALEERPEDFAKPRGDPLYMSRAQLRQHIRRLGESGGRIRKYQVDYHIRGSFPVSCLLMVLLGSVLSLGSRRGGHIALGVGMSLFLGFAYFAFIRIGQALGYHGTLPPLLAAWLGNLVFAAVGLFLLWRMHR
jgi:lipopolysaccharide export system permease protein